MKVLNISHLEDKITQKKIDRIIELLRSDLPASSESWIDAKEKLKLAQMLEETEIIPALSVHTYLKTIETIDHKTSYDHETGVHNSEEMIATLNENPHLGLEFLTSEISRLGGLRRLLQKALQRANMICEYDDAAYPHHIKGRCICETHYDTLEIPPVPLTDQQQKLYDDTLKKTKDEIKLRRSLAFDDNYNPPGQSLELVLEYDSSASKWINKVHCYACKRCLQDMVEGNDGLEGGVSCDMEMTQTR